MPARRASQLLDIRNHPFPGPRTHDEVQLKMRLACRTQRVIAPPPALLSPFRTSLQPILDVRKSGYLEKSATEWSGTVLFMLCQDLVVLISGAQEPVQRKTLFNPDNMWKDGVVDQVLAHVKGIHQAGDAVVKQVLFRTDAGKLQELGGSEDALGDDDFVSSRVGFLPLRPFNLDASGNAIFNNDLPGVPASFDGHVWFAMDIGRSVCADALVLCNYNVSHAVNIAAEDILCPWVSAAFPSCAKRPC